MSAPLTYGRKAVKRQRQSQDPDTYESQDVSKSPTRTPSSSPTKSSKPFKRPRMKVEVVLPLTPRSGKTPSPTKKSTPSHINGKFNRRPVLETPGHTKPSSPKRRKVHPATEPKASSSAWTESSADELDFLRGWQLSSKKRSRPPQDPPDDVLPTLDDAAPGSHTSEKHRRQARTPSPPPKSSASPRLAPFFRPAASSQPSPSSKVHATYLSRTPLQGSKSLPMSSPLTPITPETPIRRTSTYPTNPSPSRLASSPKPSTKNLADLFKFSSLTSKYGKPTSSPKHRLPIAKRMLARSRTEPSLESAPEDQVYDSIISISSTSTHKLSQLNRGDTVLDIPPSTLSDTRPTWLTEDDPAPPRPPPVPIPGTSQSSNVRTYAGASRSFLVPIPSANLPPGMTDDDLGLSQNESYKDLRRRWGVDDSEDDRRPVSPSPPPELLDGGEPSRGKGKGKAREGSGNNVRTSRVVLAPGMMNDLKSITELRNKGESRRFMDEVGYLFEGMDADVGIGVRRTSALEIVTKLCDPDFARRAKATDFLTRSWDVLRRAGAGDGDRVLDAILVLFCALAAQASSDLQELLRQDDFIPVLCRLLVSVSGGKDPFELMSSGVSDAELKKAGIGRPEKSSLTALNTVIVMKSGLLPSKACHLRQLVSYCLAALPPSALRPHNLPSIHGSLLPELWPLPSRISAYAAGLPLLSEEDIEDTPDFQHIENCLSILDSFLLGRWSEGEQKVPLCDDIINGDCQDDLTRGLLSLCIVSHAIVRDRRHKDLSFVAGRCLESALRVLINLSHENPAWCHHLLKDSLTSPLVMSLISSAQYQQRRGSLDEKKPSVADLDADVSADEEHDGQGFDRLCLALGLLTNLVQADEEAKDVIRDTRLDPNCPGERSCARSCHCISRVGALECLVQVYLHYRKIESDSADSNDPSAYIIRGHLAVLFGLLMRQNSRNEEALIAALPGMTRYAKLDDLVVNAREFVGLYADFMVRIAREGMEKDNEDQSDEARDGREADVGRVMRERAGEDVARDVVLFLELLRDQ